MLQLYAILLLGTDRTTIERSWSGVILLARAMPMTHTHGKREEEAMPAMSPSIRINRCPTDDHVALHLAAGS